MLQTTHFHSSLKLNSMEKNSRERVRFNVGGKIFETTSTTLSNAGRGSFFGALLDDDWNLRLQLSSSTNIPEYFIDRNPDCFGILLDLLRTSVLCIPPSITETLLYKEAQFYGLTSLVRAAKWGPIDGNRLSISRSVVGRASGDGTAIRASPEGGCCTAHGCIVHVYDWTLQQHCPPINLDYQLVNDICWVDSESIIVSACERLGQAKGGMGLFSSSTAQLRHKFPICHENQDNKSYTAGALSYSSNDYKIFASCKGRSNEYGVGVWDQVTGQQVDFFYGWPFGDADKLQWLDGTNCLLVSTMYPRKDNCCISLLDFRSKRIAWSWSDKGTITETMGDDKRVRDAVAMEERRAICVVNDYEDLGFMDLRSSVSGSSGVRWRHQIRIKSGESVGEGEVCFPRLVAYEGQLFCSKNNCISVFSGPDWVLTSSLMRVRARSIYDFSIGGDRLFALHSEGNVFDVWETPPPI